MTPKKRKEKGTKDKTESTYIDNNTKKEAIEQWKKQIAGSLKQFNCSTCNSIVSTSHPVLKEVEQCYNCALEEYLKLRKAKA